MCPGMVPAIDRSQHTETQMTLDLDTVVRERQTHISQGTLRQTLDTVLAEHPSAGSDPRFRFLEVVADYDEAVRGGRKDPMTWIDLLSAFGVIETSTPELAFYIPNYQLLCARNAGKPTDAKVPELFSQATTAALGLPNGEHEEALGHLNYNFARWLLKQGRHEDALKHWQIAATERMLFYRHMIEIKASHERRLAAAQQVAKMSKDFPSFFPGESENDCGVDPAIIQELEADFPDGLYAFSARPS